MKERMRGMEKMKKGEREKEENQQEEVGNGDKVSERKREEKR
jgi:hypothetical protein